MPQQRTQLEPPVYAFRVRVVGGAFAPRGASRVWRDIEIAGSLTLEDLAGAILDSFEFDEDHLWSFFLSGRPWDRKTEYALTAEPGFIGEGPPRLAGKHKLRDIPIPKHEFLLLFDYGDEWMFGVDLIGTSDDLVPKANYPRVVATQGDPPPQYPELDEDGYFDFEPMSDDEFEDLPG